MSGKIPRKNCLVNISQDLWIITEQALMNWIKSAWAVFILCGLREAWGGFVSMAMKHLFTQFKYQHDSTL
jgi:hypothetical protein